MSSGFTTSAILTSAVMAWPPSLTPLEMAICECSSMIPLVKCMPLASIMRAPAGALMDCRLTLIILPSCTKTSAPTRIPSFSLVQTVAFLKRSVSALSLLWLPKAIFGYHTSSLCKLSGLSAISACGSAFFCWIADQRIQAPWSFVPSPSKTAPSFKTLPCN